MDEGSCCSSAPDTATLHEELSDLLSKYDVNAAAASVKVYAIKPKAEAVIKTALPCCAPGC
jgi:arsenite methyltransferase